MPDLLFSLNIFIVIYVGCSYIVPGPIIKTCIQNSSSLLLAPLEMFGHPSIIMEVGDNVLFLLATSVDEVRQLTLGIPHRFPNVAESVMHSFTTPLCGSEASFPELRKCLIANFEDCSTLERVKEVMENRGFPLDSLKPITSEGLIEDSCLEDVASHDINGDLDGSVIQFPLIDEYFDKKIWEGGKMQLIGKVSPIKNFLKI